MSAVAALVVVWALIGASAALVALYGAIALERRIPWLAQIEPKTPVFWPDLSIIVPACNEATTLHAAMSSLLVQDYPRLEVVLVEDRSTDGTKELADHIAASDPRVKVVHVETLPDGWLGKVNALQRGVEESTGKWLLFTDADIHFAPGALKRTIAYAEEKGLGHLCCLPEVRARNFWVGLAVSSALRAISTFARPWAAVDPKSKKAIGMGAYNLVKREALDQTPGFEWLRLEVADDIGLGLMLKNHGFKPGVLRARGQVIVEWYPTLRALSVGLEKNAFAQMARFSLFRGLFFALLGLIGAFGPLAAFLPIGPPNLWALGVVALVAHVIASLLLSRTAAIPFLWCFLSMPLGDLIMSFIVARATIVGWRRGGLIWRGTIYSTAELVKGRRVDF